MEVGELHKSKRQLIELNEQKDLELSEKNATMKSYLDKIVSFSAFWFLVLVFKSSSPFAVAMLRFWSACHLNCGHISRINTKGHGKTAI